MSLISLITSVCLAFFLQRNLAGAQSINASAVANVSSVSTVTQYACYNPAVATAPYTLLGKNGSAVTTWYPEAGFEVTTVLPNDSTEVFLEHVFTTTSGGSQVAITETFSSSLLTTSATPTTASGTFATTTVLPNGQTEVIYERILTTTNSDGSVATTTEAISTSLLGSGLAPAAMTTFTTIMPDGEEAVVYGNVQEVTANGTLTTTVQGTATSTLGPVQTTVTMTITLPDGRREAILAGVYEITSDGSALTTTQPFTTSTIAYSVTTSLPDLVSSIPSNATGSSLFSTLTVLSTVSVPTTEVITTTESVPVTISGVPTTITSVSTYNQTFTVSQTVTEPSPVPLISLSGYSCQIDNCLAAVQDLAPNLGIVFADCAQFQTRTFRPATITYSATETTSITLTQTESDIETDTTTVLVTSAIETDGFVETTSTTTTTTASSSGGYTGTAIAKRDLDPEPTIPAYVGGYCVASADYASACSCIGVPASTFTAPAPSTTITTTSPSYAFPTITITASTTTVNATSTVDVTTSTTATEVATATATVPPPLFVLQSTADNTLYLAVDDTGAAYLTRDTTLVEPFYYNDDGLLVDWVDPMKTLVITESDISEYATDLVTLAAPAEANFPIDCESNGPLADELYSDCTSTGPADGPVTQGFAYCPNEGSYLFFLPSGQESIACDSGTVISGFTLIPYPPIFSFGIQATGSGTSYDGMYLQTVSLYGNQLTFGDISAANAFQLDESRDGTYGALGGMLISGTSAPYQDNGVDSETWNMNYGLDDTYWGHITCVLGDYVALAAPQKSGFELVGCFGTATTGLTINQVDPSTGQLYTSVSSNNAWVGVTLIAVPGVGTNYTDLYY